MKDDDAVIFLGAFAPKLKHQGFRECESEQRDANAITRLGISGLLTATEVHRARKRLAKRLRKIRREL